MKDITERLRETHPYSGMVDPLDIEAANEIDRLREALTVLSSDFDHAFAAETREDTIKNVERIALRALGQSGATPRPSHD